MPRELIAIAPRTPVLREYEEPELGACQVRIRTEFASPKHGTELVGYRNDPAAGRRYDPALGAVETIDEAIRPTFPKNLGNMAVGVVTEVGPDVTRFRVSDRVFGHLPIRETHTVSQDLVDPMPDGLSDVAAVCLDPAVMAFPIRDAGIRLGDRVAVFGLGAIGLFAVQFAKLAGAAHVLAVDPIAGRRALAVQYGADAALNPGADDGDVGRAIRRLTAATEMVRTMQVQVDSDHIVGGYRELPTQLSDLGVDVAVEASGNIRALNAAIRSTRFGGTVCVLSYYGGDSAGLFLGEEFHINRLQLVSARAQSLPLRDSPGWTLRRVVETTLDWLVNGQLKCEGIVTPIVAFADAVEAYEAIDELPDQSIKLGITFHGISATPT